MAESINEVSCLSSNRLKDYKQRAKEPEEVKSTRKLVEGINLRRNQREKQFDERRTLGGDKDIKSLDVNAGNIIENSDNDNLNVKQEERKHKPFPVQPPSLLQGPLQGPSAVGQGMLQLQSPLSLQGPLLRPSDADQGLFQLQSPLSLQGLPQGLSAVGQGLLQLQSPSPLQGLPQGLSAVGQGLLPAFPTSLPPGPCQGLPPLMLQGQRLSPLLHPEPVQHQGLLGDETEEMEVIEQEQCLEDTDESECDDVEDYASKKDKCLQQEMKQNAELLHSEKESEVLEGIEYFKKYLEKDYPRQSYLEDVTIIPQLVQLLSCSKDCKLHVSVLYVLMLIATQCYDHIEDIIEAGGVPVLIEFVTLENQEVAENALTALVSIAAEDTEARDCVLKHGMVPALMRFGEELNQLPKDFLELIICMIVQIFRSQPHYDAQKVLPLIGLLKEIVTVSTEKGVVHHVCSALFFMSESNGENPLIQAVVDSGICQILIHHIDWNEMSAVHAMRTFVNIASKGGAYIQFLLDLDILNVLKPLIENYRFKTELLREVFRLLSKIMTGTQQQIQMVIDCELIGPILDSLAKSYCGAVREECVWCTCNLLSRGNPDQRRYAVSQGCIAALCGCINDETIFGWGHIIASLKELQSLITDSCEPDAEYHMSLVEECGGLDEIKKRKDNHWSGIDELSCSIIDLFTRRKEQKNK